MTYEELVEVAFNNLLYKKALDDLGIYPQATIQPDGTRIERTEWQNGFNKAQSETNNKVIQFHQHIKQMDEKNREALKTLFLNEDYFYFGFNGDQFYMYLLVNDIFFTAADMEDVVEGDMPELLKLHNSYGFDGLIAWVAKKRNQEPLTFKWTKSPEYLRAEKELNGR